MSSGVSHIDGALKAAVDGRLQDVLPIFNAGCKTAPSRRARRKMRSELVEQFANRSAQALDEGDYKLMKRLYDALTEGLAISEDRVKLAFSKSGGGMELIPIVVSDHCFSMNALVRG